MKKLTENCKGALKTKDLSFELARKLNFKKSLGCVPTILLLILIGCQATQTFAQTCSTAPADLVSWYQGQNSTIDFINTNNGTIQGNVTYTTGHVGQTFTLGGAGNTSGSGDRVIVGNPTNLQLQDFTIEGWIKRSSNTIVTNSPVAGFEGGVFFSYGANGYGFVIDQSTNRLGLTKIGVSAVYSNLTISDTNFHHVAVTKSGNQVTFYVDGVADAPITYNTTFTFATNAAIGARGDNDARNAFFGSIDELSIYNRSLAASEIQAIVAAGTAGKCPMPNTFTVTNTNDSGAGSLRQAILDSNAATGADAIIFDTGVFSTPQIITLTSGDLVLTNSVNSTVMITGPGANLLTVSGNNASKIFSVADTPVVNISGMTLTGGNGVGASPGNTFGGAVYNQGVLTLTDMVITGNSAGNDGGGVYNSTSDSLTLINCVITNNTAANLSGGVHNHTSATMTITDSTIANNTSTTGGGGGIYSEDGSTLSLTNSIVSGNQALGASGSGAGILADSITLTMANSTISGNAASAVGGGLAFDVDSTATITGSTFSGNSAATRGGGIDLQPDSNNLITIENSTVSGNTAPNGAGIFRVASASLTVTLNHVTVANNTATNTGGGINGTFNLRNTLVGDNTAPTSPDYAGTLNSNDYNLIENIAGITFSGTTTNNITGVDPNLGSLTNNGGLTFTHALNTGSPAIDKGSSGSLTTDQRGQTRPVDNPSIANASGGDGADIGAFEVQPVLQFDSATYTVAENAPTVTITVTRTGGTNGADSVAYATSDGTAAGGASCAAGIDYITASGTVNFADTESSKTFTITICDDSDVEPDETVNITLSTPIGATLGSPSAAVLTITNEDVAPTPTPGSSVVTNTNDSGLGSLRQAVLNANAAPGADTISFDGSFSGSQTILLTSGEIVITDDLTITGPGANLLTVSGGNTSRIFAIGETPVVDISGMTLTSGNGVGTTSGFGGAIYNQGALTLSSVVVTGNTAATNGGAIFNSGNDFVTIIDSFITNNTANGASATGNGGGAIYSDDGSTLTITNSSLTGNSTQADGGAIVADSITLTITDSTISANTAVLFGGGIEFDVNSTATISGSTFSYNNAGVRGGGIDIQADTNDLITITNSTISGNTAPNGAGIFREAAASLTVTLNYCTVANNSATGTGGGINGTMNLAGSLVGDNNAPTSPDYAGTLNSQGYNLVENIAGTTITGDTTGNIIGLDPKLGPLANNLGPTFTHGLLLGSPAFDAADPADFPSVDQRGTARPQNGDQSGGALPDIGAFEAIAPTSSHVSVSGKVLASGKPVRGAIVELIDPDGGSAFIRTSKSGSFGFTELEAGSTYVIAVSAPGHTFEPLLLTPTEDASVTIQASTRKPGKNPKK